MTNCDIQPIILALTIKSAKEAVQLYFAPLQAFWKQVRPHAVGFKEQSNPKRIFDFLLASFLLMFFLPCLIMVAILIKLTSKGPVFYSSPRLGKNGRVFRFFKFRTIYVSTVPTKATARMVEDPRFTPIGRLLDWFSLDELPALISILRGDISFVGPRPLPLYVPLRMTDPAIIDWLRLRSRVVPGITGMWQVRPGFGFNSLNSLMALDVEYVQKQSWFLDLKILCTTVIAALIPLATRRTLTARAVDELTEFELRKLAHV